MDNTRTPYKIGLALFLFVFFIGTGFLPTPPPPSATFYVDTLTDADDSLDGRCSLREAIIAANNDSAYNEGTLNIENCRFNHNHSDRRGGAIFSTGTSTAQLFTTPRGSSA